MKPSIKNIDSRKTTKRSVGDVIYFGNPGLNCEITSDGRVFNKTTRDYVAPTPSSGNFAIKLTGAEYVNPTSWNSLISYIHGIVKTRHSNFVLIDSSKGWLPENIAASESKIDRKSASVDKTVTVIPVSKIVHQETIDINGFEVIEFKSDAGYITSDGNKFNDRDEAYSHQDKLDDAARAAKLIIASKAGYTLARNVFDSVAGYTEDFNTKLTIHQLVDDNTGISYNDGVTKY